MPHQTLQRYFLPVPQLMYCREDFPEAVKWDTKLRNGSVDIYLDDKIISAKERMNLMIKRIKKNEHNYF